MGYVAIQNSECGMPNADTNSKFRMSALARVARRIAGNACRRIAVAQGAASLEVSSLCAELRAVKRLEQPAAADLPRDRGERVLCARGSGRRILRRIGGARPGAAIGVPDEDASDPVDRYV